MKPDTPQSWKEAITALPPGGCDTAACPDPEQIWSAVRGELVPDEFGRVADHTAACPACALAWQLAEKGSTEIGRPLIQSDRRPWRAWYGVAAAMLVVAVTLSIQFRESDQAPVTTSPEYRAPVEESVRSELPEGAALPRIDCTLRWSGPEGATFSINVADESFQTVHRETGLTGSTFTIPPDALQGIPAGGVIVWQVEALLPDGTRKLSRTFRTTVE
jgi:hypothetical protein